MATSTRRRTGASIRRTLQCCACMLAACASVASGEALLVVELERLPSVEREFRLVWNSENHSWEGEAPAELRGSYQCRAREDFAQSASGPDGRLGRSLARPQENVLPHVTAPLHRLAEFQEEIPPPGEGPPTEYVDPLYGDEFVPLDCDCCPSCGCACGGGLCANCASCGCYAPWEASTHLGRFCLGLYRGLCCPDPCYEPCWNPLADSAFFVDAARPVTQSRFRWDGGYRMVLPDRAEYFWARSGGGGSGRPQIESELTYHDLTHYTEACVGGFSMFVELSYRSLYPDVNAHTAGFGDLTAGTKSLLFDCELMQVTFQNKFITPVGNPMKGLGTGHLSIEPSLLTAIKVSEHVWVQTQLSEWIPLGGNPEYAGAILHYHAAVNASLLGTPGGIQVVGTMEASGWSFQDGAYSDPVLGQLQRASNYTYLSVGGGVRVFVCNKIDFGVGTTMAIGDEHWAEQLIRAEFRARF